MKYSKILVAALATTCVISGAYAKSPAPSAATTTASKADSKQDMGVEKHIKDLHAKLKITSGEEVQWAEVVQAMRESAIELDKVIDKRKALAANATAIDDLNAYGEIAQAHADGVKKLSAAFSKLYSTMPDDQKRVADAVFAHRAHH